MNCPSCGRPIKFEEKYAKVLSCMYCNTVLEFGGTELTKIGEQSEFIEFPSVFVVGKEVEWNGKKIYVKGQLRYEYDGGFFDKFFVIIDGKNYYIKEDDGIITVTKQGDWQDSEETLLDKEPGTNQKLLGDSYFIQENGTLKLVNIKGFVNSYLVPGKDYEYLDGIKNGKLCFLEKEIGKDRIRVSEEVETL